MIGLTVTFHDGPLAGQTKGDIAGKRVETSVFIWRDDERYILGGYGKCYYFLYEYCPPIINHHCLARMTTQSRHRWAQVRKLIPEGVQ